MVSNSTNNTLNHLAPQTFDTNVPCHIYRPAQNTAGLTDQRDPILFDKGSLTTLQI